MEIWVNRVSALLGWAALQAPEADDCVEELIHIEPRLAEEIDQVALSLLGTQGDEPFGRDVEGVVADQGVIDDQVAVHADGRKEAGRGQPVEVVLAERHAHIMLDLVIQQGVVFEELPRRKTRGSVPGSLLEPSHGRGAIALGLFEHPLRPAAKLLNLGRAFVELQVARGEKPVKVSRMLLNLIDHSGVEGARSKVMTGLAAFEPFGEKGGQPEGRVPATIEHCHVIVARDGNATFEARENGWSHPK